MWSLFFMRVRLSELLTYLTMRKRKEINKMGVYIAIISTFAFVMIALFYQPKRHKQMKENYSVTDRYNDLAVACNKLSNEYSFALRNKQSEIIIANDVNAGNTLRNIVDDANDELSCMTDYMSRAYNCLSQKDNAGSLYCIENAAECKARIESYISHINAIAVVDRRHTYEETHQTERPQSETVVASDGSYFNGCSTKEEIDTRYRALAKVFHPDAKAGDEKTFQNINDQYHSLLKQCEQ